MSADTHKKPRKFVQDRDAVAWKGRYEPYDLAKEFLVALIVVIILVTGLAVLFGSPDDKPVTVRSWSTASRSRWVSAPASRSTPVMAGRRRR